MHHHGFSSKFLVLSLLFIFNLPQLSFASVFDLYHKHWGISKYSVYEQTQNNLKVQVTAHTQRHQHDYHTPTYDDPDILLVQQDISGIGVLYKYSSHTSAGVVDEPQLDSYAGFNDHLEFRFYDSVTGNPQRVKITRITFKLFEPKAGVDDAIISTLDGQELIHVTDRLIGDTLSYKAFAHKGESIHLTATWNLKTSLILDSVKIAAGSLSAFRVFSIEAEAYNNPPCFITTPVLKAQETLPYVYQSKAEDADNDKLTYELLSSPAGMTINSDTGLVKWSPNEGQAGDYTISIRVKDIYGGEDTQTYKLTVLPKPNEAPVITSLPVKEATTSVLYSYKVIATDADGDELAYKLQTSPQGMQINAKTGQITWNPTEAQVGDHNVVVVVTDPRGASDSQSYMIKVILQNKAPTIVSKPVLQGTESNGYLYDVDAIDPNPNDVLSYANKSFSLGVKVDKLTGVTTWRPSTKFVENTRLKNDFCVAESNLKLGQFAPVEKYNFKVTSSIPYANYNQVMHAPIAVPLMDTNGDGKVTAKDDIAIIFQTFASWQYNGVGYIRAIWAKNGQHIWTSSVQVTSVTSLAAADIDNDGSIEIVTGKYKGGLVALNSDGTLKWSNNDNSLSLNWGGPAFADLEGDGQTEIIVGNTVLDHSGNIKWKGTSISGPNNPGPLSVIADINLDGYQEVIIGADIYSHTGDVIALGGEGLSALGNFDSDNYPEIVRVRSGSVYLHNHDGSLIWSKEIPGGGNGGPPTVADLTGDGIPEIGVAGGSKYAVFNAKGALAWSSSTVDQSSSLTGSSVFDFDGNGRAEVVYADEYYLRVYDGPTGEVLYEVANSSDTTYELPVIADIDHDGHAEIVIIANNYARSGKTGIRVFEDTKDSWAPTRSIWNQHAYNINNINDDLTIPAKPVKSWLTHNTFRLNSFPDRPAYGQPDISLNDIQYNQTANTLSVVMTNRGLAPVSVPVSVQFTHEHFLLGEQNLGAITVNSLAMGEAVKVTLPLGSSVISQSIRADAIVPDSVKECVKNNNSASATLLDLRAYDPAGLYDSQKFIINLTNENEPPVITSSPTSTSVVGKNYTFTVQVADNDKGDDHKFSLINPPAGFEISPFGGVIRAKTPAQGAYDLLVEVRDLAGATVRQSHKVAITPPNNLPPVITSKPIETAIAGQPYTYDVEANDPEGAALIYTLTRTQAGMSIDAQSGEIKWTPNGNNIGPNSVEVTVFDAQGAQSKQYFLIVVRSDNGGSGNHAPVITSTPSGLVTVGQKFVYNVVATDADKDSLSYRLSSQSYAPDNYGMSIDSNGVFTWTPAQQYVGQSLLVDVIVEDGRGGMATQRLTLSVNQLNNNPPVITSTPTGTIQVGQEYTYNVTAIDPDKDALTYRLSSQSYSPKSYGMSIDTNGLFKWLPAQQFEGQTVKVDVIVEDGRGGVATQNLTLPVKQASNKPPVISSTPSLVSHPDVEYRYTVSAKDPDGDTVTLSLTDAPSGMQIQGSLITWTPSATLNGQRVKVKLRAEDNRGAAAIQSFEIAVQALNTSNELPIISSLPKAPAFVAQAYRYQIAAIDPDGDPLSYSVTNGPAGATVSSQGLFSWTPTNDQLGDNAIALRVSDSKGWVTQSFNLPVVVQVANNNYPEITSQPTLVAAVQQSYRYQISATDKDNDSLTYGLTKSPKGMTISASGLISWTPELSQIGAHQVDLYVDDGKGKSLQTYTVNVSKDAVPLGVLLVATPKRVELNQDVTISLLTTGGKGKITQSLTIDGQPLTLNNSGQAKWKATTGGLHKIVAKASDENGQITKEAYVSVKVSADTTAPNVTIHSPSIDSTHTKAVPVVATISDENLALYRVYTAQAGSQNWQLLKEGYNTLDNAEAAVFDPTLLLNGQYSILVYAEDVNGKTTTESVGVIVDGDLKVGNFSLSFVDLDIPLAGIPIRVTRTYDSRRRFEDLDFGYGWSIDYQNVQVNESRKLGKFWTINEYKRGPLNAITDFCVEPLGAPVVTITLPNGDIEKFEVKAKNSCYTFQVVKDVELAFKPVGDTQSTLSALDGASARYEGGTLLDRSFTQAIDPDRYLLTTKAGYQYYLHQKTGIEKIIDPNGYTLTYTKDGIFHSSGKSVAFVRNSDGRIKQIVDPANNTLRYQYSAEGDLTRAIDAELAETQYTYNRSHGLLEIIDPLNRKVIKNLYDEKGRLYAQEDGDGNVKTFTHDLNAKSTVVTDLDGRTTSFHYDDRGNVTKEVKVMNDGIYSDDIVTTYTFDARDNQTTRTIGTSTWTNSYDTRNNLLFAQDPEGNKIRYTAYTARGQEKQIYDEMNRLTEMTYDSAGNLYRIDMPEVTDPDTNTKSRPQAGNVINAQGLVEKTTDLRGHVTTYTYYPKGHTNAGQKKTESNAKTGTMRYEYDANNNVVKETRERTVNGTVVQESTAYEYNKRNQLVKTTYHDGSYTETVYDLAGNMDKERDRFGVWTDYEYDVYGRLTRTDYTDGSSETRTYTKEGLLDTITDRMNRETKHEYDGAGRLWKVTHPDNSYTETRYTPQGWVSDEWDENRNHTRYQYDKAGRRTAVIRTLNGREITHNYTYYPNGELQSETDALNRTTRYQLNALDQRIQTDYHNNTSIKQRFDAMGTRTRHIDQNNIAIDYRHDAIGRLEQVQPDVEINNVRIPNTRYTYDQAGNKLTQTDANGHTTTWTYDLFGRVLSRTLPLGQQETFAYDDTARTQTHTDFNGQINITSYDELGRIKQINYHDGLKEEYTYYHNGQIKTVVDQHGTTQYGYDNRDRLAYTVKPDGSRLDYQYDAVGNRTQVKTTVNTTVNGTVNSTITTVDYTYDALNRLKTVKDANGTTTYTYYDNGNLHTISYPNGNVATHTYNTVNQLTNLTTKDANGQVLTSYSYTLDNTGRRKTITEHNGRSTQYGYDGLYRLTSETITDSNNGNHAASYQYDWVGNRTYETVNGVQTQYTYDDNDRLTQQGGTVYTYDNNGNTKTETLDGNTTTYTYNAKNKLTAVDKAGTTTGYTYNHNGIRTSKTHAGKTTHFIIDENRDYAQVLQEVENNAITVSYTYGHDLISQDRNNTESYYHYDGLGSTRALSSKTGALTDTYNYEAFGEVLNKTGSTENSYLFTGEQFDSGLDQYYLRARYYDQNAGRFTQQDTWMGRSHDPITLNKYLYANADPVMYTDPTGYFSIGSLMTTVNVAATLATTAQSAYDLFGSVSEGDSVSATQVGMVALASLGGIKLFKMVGKKFLKRFNCGKPNEHKICKIFKSDDERINAIRSSLGLRSGSRNVAFADYITNSGIDSIIGVSGRTLPGTVGIPVPLQTGWDGHDRSYDAEVKLYSTMTSRFSSSTKGLVRLVSELKFCGSCTRVGTAFKLRHRGLFVITSSASSSTTHRRR